MNAIRRTTKRAQDHIELGLELCDSSELDAQLPFSVAKPLVDRPRAMRRPRRVELRQKRRLWRPKEMSVVAWRAPPITGSVCQR